MSILIYFIVQIPYKIHVLETKISTCKKKIHVLSYFLMFFSESFIIIPVLWFVFLHILSMICTNYQGGNSIFEFFCQKSSSGRGFPKLLSCSLWWPKSELIFWHLCLLQETLNIIITHHCISINISFQLNCN